MPSDVTKLRLLTARRLKSAGFDWKRLDKTAQQIIVFGSYALASNTMVSDLDLLCIGEGHNFKSPRIHLVWISAKKIQSEKWLGSELATHVATYGKWIKGSNTWARKTKPNAIAIAAKRRNIIGRVEAMNRHWDDLLPHFRYNQLTKLRRDLQRFRIMQRGSAPVPKTLLDAEWCKLPEAQAWEMLLQKHTRVSQLVADFLQHRQILNLRK
jgi:hypothetical protein